jgi:hypothetical protein
VQTSSGAADLLKAQQSETGLTKIRGLSGEVSYGRRWFAPIGQRVGAAVCSHSVGIWCFRVCLSCRGVGGTSVSNSLQHLKLHEVWDTGILETENGSAKQIAKRLDGQIRDVDRKAWQSGTPKDWANESIAINTRYVYPLPENHEISEEYAKRALPILHKRLVQAGVWLAWLLNEGLK